MTTTKTQLSIAKIILFLTFILLIMNDSLAQNSMDDRKSDGLIFPISIEIDPMEKLLLVNFEKDPDSVYVAFEPQVFNDGHLILAYRTDKKVDVYHTKSLKRDPSLYGIVGAGLNEMIPVDMEKTFFEVNEFGVQVHYQFKDILDREVEIFISEKNQKKRKPFGLLAPMGDAATNPPSLPVILLHDFYFVRKNKTELKVSINGKPHKLDNLPIRMDWQKMKFTRYSPKPLIATLNPEYNGVLNSFDKVMGQETFEKGDCIYEIEYTDQNASVKSMSVKNNIHLLTISFTPSFPCLNTVSENSQYKGKFTITGHESVGSIAGEYMIQSDKEFIHIRLVPTKGWKPKITKFSTRFLFTFVKVFKKWTTTYQWDAELQKNQEGLWYMQSKWIRTGKIMKDLR